MVIKIARSPVEEKMYVNLISATNNEWLAEKICFLFKLEVLLQKTSNSRFTGKLESIKRHILNLDDDSTDRDFSTYYNELITRYPLLRQQKDRETFYPASENDSLHIHPEWIKDLNLYLCPFCKVNHLEIISHSSNGFEYKTAGCKTCNKNFTPSELEQICYFSLKKPMEDIKI